MRIRGTILFSLFFCMIIALVPVVQSVRELLHRERLQAADLFEDTFLTPHRRSREIDAQILRLLDTLGVCERLAGFAGADGRLYGCVEEALTIGENLRRRYIEINRHVSDSDCAGARRADSMVRRLEALMTAVDEGEESAVSGAIVDVRAAAAAFRGGPAKRISIVRPVVRIVHAFFRSTFFSNRYLRSYEKELEERSLAAQKVRPLMQVARYALLGDLGVKAVAGRCGWLFYRPGIEYLYRPPIDDARAKSVDYNDKAVYDDPVAVIADFKHQLEARGIELTVVIVPGKGSIYPDLVSGRISPDSAGMLSHTGRIMRKLRECGVTVIDLFGPFAAERKNDSLCGDSLYLARDTHWRSRALRLAARRVAESVRKSAWYGEEHPTLSYSMDSVSIDRIGDIVVMTDLPDVHVNGLKLLFAPEKATCYPVMRDHLDGNGALLGKEPYHDDFKHSRILVLGDSFSRIYQTDKPGSAGWIAHLALELGEPLASIISDGGASTLVREKLARKPGLLKGKRLVIWEFVERDLRFGAFGWQAVKLPE
jgi:hypothetical protein